MSKKNKINKGDELRVLLTETLPYETPISFSADYLYSKLKSSNSSTVQSKIIELLILNSRECTIPYHYQIRKNKDSFRRLALLHPSSQVVLQNFYRQYSSLILHYTSRSSFSIRSPHKIAGSFYTKNNWANIHKYKDESKISSKENNYAKHVPSYFSYRGYDRLWKFYDSSDYVNLERRFQNQVSIDVAKCFDSIYTHCIGWATKEKQFVKDNRGLYTFGECFDSAIRHGNHAETNGIPIGPECSRIFAEIILQRIDIDVQRRLTQYIAGNNYIVKRYVDDINIFAENEIIANSVKSAYIECLLKYNLHINPSKTEHLNRPYSTTKSTLIQLISKETEQLANTIFKISSTKIEAAVIYEPKIIFNKYIASLKSICHLLKADFYDLSSWVIAVFNERIKKLCDGTKKNIVNDEDLFKCVKIVLDICFFLYGVAPSVNASYKLGTIIILLVRYFNFNELPSRFALKHHIYHCVIRMLDENRTPHNAQIDEFIDLEKINIVLAAQELGSEFLLSTELLEEVFFPGNSSNCFTLAAGLFYIRDFPIYKSLRNDIINKIDFKLGDCSDVGYKSEQAHIFLDAVGCPYISTEIRRKWVRNLIDKNGKNFNNSALDQFIVGLGSEWTSCWNGVDLLTVLERRELKSAY